MKKQNFIWLLIGIMCFSIVLGLFMGASNSPVAGVVISSIFGIAVAAIGIWAKNPDGEKQVQMNVNFSYVGKCLVIFSIFILIGVHLGIKYRTGRAASQKSFIWNNSVLPGSTYEALDWITVSELLNEKGFTQTQIEALYKLRVLELSDTSVDVYGAKKYSENTPYAKMLISVGTEKKTGRGLASE